MNFKTHVARSLLLTFLSVSTVFSQSLPSDNAHPVSKVWVADKGDGTYKNPVIHADYSDPDVIRVGDDFYLTASSFNAVPGLPILQSKDLVNWRLVSHALARQPPNWPLATPPDSDDFSGNELGRQWQWHANPQSNWAAATASSFQQ